MCIITYCTHVPFLEYTCRLSNCILVVFYIIMYGYASICTSDGDGKYRLLCYKSMYIVHHVYRSSVLVVYQIGSYHLQCNYSK